MDTDELFQQARSRFEHSAARRVLKEKYEAKMIFSHNGGMWRAGPELWTVLQMCGTEPAVVLDLYGTPIMVNPVELQSLVHQHWQEQMNAWLVEHQETMKQR